MKIYRLPLLAAEASGGEYRLGINELNTENFTLLYGTLRPNEMGRRAAAATDSVSVVCVIKGSINVRCGRTSFLAASGSAFSINGGQEYVFDNIYDTEAAYIIAGGKADRSVTVDAKIVVKQPENESRTMKEEPRTKQDESEHIITKDESIS